MERRIHLCANWTFRLRCCVFIGILISWATFALSSTIVLLIAFVVFVFARLWLELLGNCSVSRTRNVSAFGRRFYVGNVNKIFITLTRMQFFEKKMAKAIAFQWCVLAYNHYFKIYNWIHSSDNNWALKTAVYSLCDRPYFTGSYKQCYQLSFFLSNLAFSAQKVDDFIVLSKSMQHCVIKKSKINKNFNTSRKKNELLWPLTIQAIMIQSIARRNLWMLCRAPRHHP